MLGRESEGIWRDELRACANQVPNSSWTRKSLVHVRTLWSQAEGRGGQPQKQPSDSHSSAHDYMRKPVRILGSRSPIHVQYRRLSGLVSPSLRFHTDKLKLSKALAVQQRDKRVTMAFLEWIQQKQQRDQKWRRLTTHCFKAPAPSQ